MTIRPTSPTSAPEVARPPAPPAAESTPESLPDLVVLRLDPITYFPRPGQEIDFRVEVHNRGQADAGPFSVSLDLEGSRDEERLPGLAAGARADLEMSAFSPPGDHREWFVATARADSKDEVEESKERNNRRSVTLWNPQPPRPPVPPVPPPPIPPRP